MKFIIHSKVRYLFHLWLEQLFLDDVEYYLSNILFHEFDTVVEDGSLEEVSKVSNNYNFKFNIVSSSKIAFYYVWNRPRKD